MVDQQPRRRRRGAALEVPIFDAAWTELSECGWADFQMSRVAERAAVSKASIYRRWPDRSALVRATLEHKSATTPEGATITGDLREDLLQILRTTVQLYASPFGSALRGLLSEGPPSGHDHGASSAMLDILRASGRVDDPAALPAAVVDLGLRLVSLHCLATGTHLDERDLEEIVDQAWLPALDHATGGLR